MIVVALPSSKNINGSNTKNDCPFINLKSAKKDKILFGCVVSTSTVKNVLKAVLVTKENLKSDVNTISDFIRNEKFVDFY